MIQYLNNLFSFLKQTQRSNSNYKLGNIFSSWSITLDQYLYILILKKYVASTCKMRGWTVKGLFFWTRSLQKFFFILVNNSDGDLVDPIYFMNNCSAWNIQRSGCFAFILQNTVNSIKPVITRGSGKRWAEESTTQPVFHSISLEKRILLS